MNEPKTVRFYVGQLEDGRYAATSTQAPYFCFIEDSEDAVIAKANGALDFFLSRRGVVTQRRATSQNVVNFVPRRRIDSAKEYAFA